MVSVPKSHAASMQWAYLVTTVYCGAGAKEDWMRLCALLLWEHATVRADISTLLLHRPY